MSVSSPARRARPSLRRLRRGLLAGGALIAATLPAGAATWTGGAGTSDWFNAANWDGGTLPSSSSGIALINNGGNVTIGAAGATSLYLQVGYGVGTSGTLTITGTLQTGTAEIGYGNTSNGAVIVSGTSASWSLLNPNSGVATAIWLGQTGTTTSSLLIENGATVRDVAAVNMGGTGGSSLTVTGIGSLLLFGTDFSNLIVANTRNGTGTVTVSDGGSIQNAYSIRLGGGTSTTGIMTVTGARSTVEAETMYVGYSTTSATGILTIAEGATVTISDDTTLARTATGTGTLIIGAAADAAAVAPGTLNSANGVIFGPGTSTLVFNHTGTNYEFASQLISDAAAVSASISHLAGVTTLTADSSGFGGTTSVTGGTLRVNGALGGTLSVSDAGTLGGTGTVGTTTIGSGGTLSPGLANAVGTLSVSGNLTFESGSTYLAHLTGTSSDLLSVSGSTTLNGGTLSVTSLDASTSYQTSQTYTVLSSAGGITGSFAQTVSNSAFLDVSSAVVGNDVVLTVGLIGSGDGDTGGSEAGGGDSGTGTSAGVFVTAARTQNQHATATALDTLAQTGTSLTLYNRLLILDEAAAQAAFTQLSGESHASVKTALIQDTHFARDTVNDRLRSAADSRQSFGGTALSYSAAGPVKAGTPAGTAIAKAAPQPVSPEIYTLWAKTFGSWGKTDGNGDASALTRDTVGLLVGRDAEFHNWRLGVFGGFSRSNFDTETSDSASDNYQVGGYAGRTFGAFALRTGVAYTWSDIDTDRSVSFSGNQDRFSSSYMAGTFQAFGEAGYRIDFGRASFEPFAGAAYINMYVDGFQEDAASDGGYSAAALTVNSSTMSTTLTTLGLRASTAFDLGPASGTLRGMVGWQHAFGDVTPTSSNAFATGSGFTVTGVPLATDLALVEAGVDVALTRAAAIGVSYVGQFGDGTSENGFNANLNWKF